MKTGHAMYESPIGTIYLVADETGVRHVFLTQESWESYCQKEDSLPGNEEICRSAIKQLQEYFAGSRKAFTLPLSFDGTEFQKKVWRELLQIQYGETRDYGEISEAIGNPGAVRAVGQANRVNPLPIFVPCHRVIGRNGKMTGYMGKNGIQIKEYLLNLERRCKNN